MWKRTCPSCNRELGYSNRSNYLRAIKNNSICVFCLNRKKVNNPEYIKKLSISKLGDKNPCKRLDVREKLSISGKGKHKHTDEFKLKVSRLHKGKITSDITKKKMREAVLNRIKLYGKMTRNFNPSACKIIDEYGKKNGYNFQHALNGGEIIIYGYSLDGYDKNKNVVFEYDEFNRNHFDKNGNLLEKDIKRMNEIINYLHCKFIRYNENTKIITEYGNTN